MPSCKHVLYPLSFTIVIYHCHLPLFFSDDRIHLDQIRDTAILTVSSADVTDTGKYKLVIKNELGTDNCTSSVTVEGR